MQLWIAIHNHRHGQDVYPIFQEQEPTEDEVIAEIDKGMSNFELDREDEYLDIRGPFAMPQITCGYCGETYVSSDGWYCPHCGGC